MSSIVEFIRKIREARLGKDVRESIAKAIEQTYEDASKSGNSNMEVSEARGEFETLSKRLNNSDKLKADKDDIENEVENRKKVDNNLQSQINGLSSGSPLVAGSLSEMIDTNRVYVNTTDGHKYYYDGTSWVDFGVYQATEIENDSITLEKLSYEFKKDTNNYLDVSKILEGHTFGTSSTSTINSINVKDTFNLYPVIKVTPGQQWIALTDDENNVGLKALGRYNADGNFVDFIEVFENEIITIPDDVYFIRFATLKKYNITQFKRYDVENFTTEYEPYKYSPLIVFKEEVKKANEYTNKLQKIETDFTINISNFLNKSAKTTLITWIDDDCDYNGISKVKSICDNLNIKCTFACVTSGISINNNDIENEGLNNEELKNRLLEYQNIGFHITTHSNHHGYVWKSTNENYDVEACEKDLIKSLQMLNENGFLDTNYLVTPFRYT